MHYKNDLQLETRKCNCVFKLHGKPMKNGGGWIV